MARAGAAGVPPARLGALSADASRELQVFGHDGDALGVDGAEVAVLEDAGEVGLGGLLQREHGGRLEAQPGMKALRHLLDEALEGQLADEELGGLLEAADLAERDGAGAVAVRAARAGGLGRGALAAHGRGHAWALAADVATVGLVLLGTGHGVRREREFEL